MNWIEIFPIIALILFLQAEGLQLRKTYKEKTVKGLSLAKYVISLFINILFALYYIFLEHFMTLSLNVCLGVIIVFIICLGLRYKKREK